MSPSKMRKSGMPTWLIVVLLFFVAPIGMVVVWLKRKYWFKNKPVLIILIIWTFFWVIIAAAMQSDDSYSELNGTDQITNSTTTGDSLDESAQFTPTSSPTMTPTPTPEPSPTPEPTPTPEPSSTPEVATAPVATEAPTYENTQTPTPTSESDFSFITESVIGTRNEYVTLRITGEPDVKYYITVYSPSGNELTADGLEPRIASEDGLVEWTWKVGGRTNEGLGSIRVSDGKVTKSIDYIVN